MYIYTYLNIYKPSKQLQPFSHYIQQITVLMMIRKQNNK